MWGVLLQLQPENRVQCRLEKSLGGKKYHMSDSRPKGIGEESREVRGTRSMREEMQELPAEPR